MNPNNLGKIFLGLAVCSFALGFYNMGKFFGAEQPDYFNLIVGIINIAIGIYLYVRSRMLRNIQKGFKTWKSYEK